MNHLLLTVLIIFCGLLSGYGLRKWAKLYSHQFYRAIPEIRRSLQKIGLLVFLSLAFLLAVWNLSVSNPTLFVLPLLGSGIIFSGGFLGYAAARLNRCNRIQTGTLVSCGSITNIGAMGGLVIYVFLGEKAFAFLMLYKLFEELIYYALIFPIAKFFSLEHREKENFGIRFLKTITDPFVAVSIIAFGIGVTLNLLEINRPTYFKTISSICVPVGTFLLLVSIGLGLEIRHIKGLRLSFSIAIIKFIILPATALASAYLLGIEKIDAGLPLKVIIIASSMPVGFNAIVAASVYDLDLDLANSCWLLSTSALIIIVPWLFFVVQFI